MREQKTAGIVLSTFDVFDADRLYLVLTREFGKLRARARGVRKPTSRLGGHLLQFLPTDLQLVQQGSFFLIVQAHMHAGATYPADALRYLQLAELVAEGLDKLLIEQETHTEIYDGLEYTLERLQNAVQPRLVVAEFFLKCLVALGYRPELEVSVSDGTPLNPDSLAWSSELGGVFTVPPSGLPLVAQRIESPQTVVALRQLVRPEFLAERLGMPDAIRQSVEDIIFDYLQTRIGKPLKSLARY